MFSPRIGWTALGAVFAACSADNVTAPPPAVDASTDDVSTADASTFDSAIADASPDALPADQPLVRLANFSPDAGAVDFCLAPHGTTTYIGPVIALSSPDGGASGLSFGQLTGYFALGLASGVYDVRTVAGGAAVRVLHASPGDGLGALDVGTGSLATRDFASWFTHVAYGLIGVTSAADGGAVDSDGYLGVAPFSSTTVSAHPSGGSTDAITATGLSAAAGSVTTLVLIGGKTGDTTHPIQLLLCADDAALPGGTWLAPCAVVSP